LIKFNPNSTIIGRKRIIDATIGSLLMYQDVDFRERSCGIMYFEEKIQILIIMQPYFDFGQILKVMKALKGLIDYSPDGEEVSPYGNLADEKNPYKEQDRETDPG
jgi:hypothetical protein